MLVFLVSLWSLVLCCFPSGLIFTDIYQNCSHSLRPNLTSALISKMGNGSMRYLFDNKAQWSSQALNALIWCSFSSKMADVKRTFSMIAKMSHKRGKKWGHLPSRGGSRYYHTLLSVFKWLLFYCLSHKIIYASCLLSTIILSPLPIGKDPPTSFYVKFSLFLSSINNPGKQSMVSLL